MREVPAIGEDLEATAGNRLVCRSAVRHRDHPVALAPDDQRGDVRGEVEPIRGVDALAPRIDDRATSRVLE